MNIDIKIKGELFFNDTLKIERLYNIFPKIKGETFVCTVNYIFTILLSPNFVQHSRAMNRYSNKIGYIVSMLTLSHVINDGKGPAIKKCRLHITLTILIYYNSSLISWGGYKIFIPRRLIKNFIKKLFLGIVLDLLTEIFTHLSVGYFVSATFR